MNRIGDQVGARWSDGEVTRPDGFREAYRAYVEGGWGTLSGPAEHGGQGLPLALAVSLAALAAALAVLAARPLRAAAGRAAL